MIGNSRESLAHFMGRISVATAADANAIVCLRKSAFAASEQFRMRDYSDLEWGLHDEEGIVLAAWDENGEVISTTRGEVVINAADAEERMMSTFPIATDVFPALLLSRGATRVGY